MPQRNTRSKTPSMGSSRTVRVSDQIQKDLAELIRTEVKDVRVQNAWVTITGVEVTADFSHAKVFYSVLQDTADIASIQAGLVAASGFLRRELGKRVVLHSTPALNFVYDATTKQGIAMSQLIDQAIATTPKDA